jgi:RecB family endonuclease NucS
MPPSDRTEAIEFYFHSPSSLEEGLKMLESNITIFHGKIDLFGVDKDDNMVLIDVIGDRNWKRRVNQLRKYRKYIKWTAEHIFGLKYIPFIRLLLVKPNYYVKDVSSDYPSFS